MPTCTRCSKSHSGPAAFLLTCSKCSKPWHHRCHIPPVSDTELISRIKASNAGDIRNGVPGWTCRRCGKKTEAQPQPPQPKLKHEKEKPATVARVPSHTAQTSGQNSGAALQPDKPPLRPEQEVSRPTGGVPPPNETLARPERDNRPNTSVIPPSKPGPISDPAPASGHNSDVILLPEKSGFRLGHVSGPPTRPDRVILLSDDDEPRPHPKHSLPTRNRDDPEAHSVPHLEQHIVTPLPATPQARADSTLPLDHEDSVIHDCVVIPVIPRPDHGESSRSVANGPTGIHSSSGIRTTPRSASMRSTAAQASETDNLPPPPEPTSNCNAVAIDSDDDEPLEYVDIPPALLQKYTSRKTVHAPSQTPLQTPAPVSELPPATQSSAAGPSWLYRRLLELNINSLPDTSTAAKHSTSARSRKAIARRLKSDPLIHENLFQFSAQSWLRENQSPNKR
ncbi:hypothetical protein BD779DRAFT_1503716 [Infundibulicybe gibba]|nr:hypothetical protein BD779DRAFT_1503716 [Infundibulicybe gibba]